MMTKRVTEICAENELSMADYSFLLYLAETANTPSNLKFAEFLGITIKQFDEIKARLSYNGYTEIDKVTRSLRPSPKWYEIHQISPNFEELWEAYGKKGAKPLAKTEYLRLIAVNVGHDELVKKAKAVNKKHALDPTYKHDLQNWLSQWRFEESDTSFVDSTKANTFFRPTKPS